VEVPPTRTPVDTPRDTVTAPVLAARSDDA